MVNDDNISQYNLGNFYKGTFLGYVNENYKNENDYRIYVEVKELILNKADTIKREFNLNSSNIIGLNLEGSITEINSIIAKPILYNGLSVELKEGNTVFVFFIDSDPKKIFYVPMSNDVSTFESFKLRVKNNYISVNKSNIELVHENDYGDNVGLVINEMGNLFTGNMYHNGHKVNFKEE